ncbi:MAG: serpin family protein [Lachnospiraceae bacterium]|nr:serpin family protein [Lachnospiraceae bacterium]
MRKIALILCLALLAGAVGCGNTENEEVKVTPTVTPSETSVPKPSETLEAVIDKTVDLMENVKTEKAEKTEITKEFLTAQNDFAINLLKTQYKSGENTMVSPVSAMLALAMTANGAKGQTLKEMENVLGSGIVIDDLDRYLRAYTDSLETDEKYKMHIANSIWFSDNADMIRVKEDFLKTNGKYFNAEIYKAPFDETTLKDVNNWVNTHTEEMIPSILEKVEKSDVMYLINAIAFDAEWREIYDEEHIYDGEFINAAGRAETVKMLASEERVFLKDKNAKGFMKPYAGGYAFVALLPDEGVSIDEYVASLDKEKLTELFGNKIYKKVRTRMPSFETECSFNLNEGLIEMGMPTAFDCIRADFGNMAEDDGNGNICIDRVIQKTYIKVDERGTKAGAATLVAMVKNSAALEDFEEVFLDRPFVYMIVDTANDLPLFLGVECSVK